MKILTWIWEFIKKNPRDFVIIGLILSIVFMRQCRKPCEESTIISHIDTITQYDTIKEFVHSQPQVIYEWQTDTIFVDTANAIADYFVTRQYTDTLKDSSYKIVINDKVSRNRLYGRESDIEIYNKTNYITLFKTDTVFIAKPYEQKFRLYMGIGINGWTDKFGFSGNIGFARNNSAYFLGYDPLNKTINANMLWKIRLAK